jgi:hypothetical protein
MSDFDEKWQLKENVKMTKRLLLLLALAFCLTVPLNAQIITSVVRSNGVSGDRDPIGAYDGGTAPLPMEEGGLKDGNLVFSDRTYPWSGIPAEYEGTEYIRTFNSDKNGGTVDVTYEVTTSQDAILWITVDDRIPAEWDAGGTITSQQDAADRVTAAFAAPGTFADTGIDIYIREKADGSTDRPMSVFAAELPAGTYVFESMDSDRNFYSIGAIPAEATEPEPEPEPEVPALSDVTSPGDPILGVPNDGDWPGGEYPALAIDNSSGTKFLHFKGGSMPTGIQVTPSAGATIVTGIALTTANDSPSRDPITFELSGSNVSIDGPYEVIAAGDVVDFNQVDDWPRFTKNETPITFDNDVAYEHYQLVFPKVRGATEGLMQIAEIELLGVAVNAFSPTPSDGAEHIGIDTDLTWSAGADAVSSDVYFGTETAPAFLANVEGASIDPGTLEYGTTYYWQVNTVKADGSVETGAVWSFTTTTPVGIFEYSQDIGAPAGIGRTTYEGYVWKDDVLTEQYLMMGGGADIWGNADQFHFAYNKVSGDVRLSASIGWVIASADWAKMGVMLRETTGGPSAHYFMCDRKLRDYAAVQGRPGTGDSSYAFGTEYNATNAKALGIQRVTLNGVEWIEGLVDKGSGWESTCLISADLADDLLAGVAIDAANNTQLVQGRVWNVQYELNPSMVGTIPAIPADQALEAPPSEVSGFSIRSLKTLITDGSFNTFAAMNELLDTGMFGGLPALPGSEGTRVDEFVNLRDTGNGAFSEANGYPDISYPGIDPLEQPAQDPAAGDDDNDFATEILGYIHLVPGEYYRFGVDSDDGGILEIGGVEVVRTAELKGTSLVDSSFYVVDVEGYYPLRARQFERGGGASVELHQILIDGTRLLMNDVANGAAEVYAPAE